MDDGVEGEVDDSVRRRRIRWNSTVMDDDNFSMTSHLWFICISCVMYKLSKKERWRKRRSKE